MGKCKSLHLSNASYSEYLQAYRSYVRNVGYVWHTQKSRVFIVLEFLQWLITHEITEIAEVKPVHIKSYSEYLQNRPGMKGDVLSSSSIRHHLHTIRTFFALLQEQHIIIKNPMSVLTFSFRQEERQEKQVLTIAEVMTLYRFTETLQERAFLSLCYGCGLRSMELSALNIEDLKLKENHITILHGKGNKKRLIPINQRIRSDIEQYINNERVLYQKERNQQAVLLNSNGERMRKYTFVSMLNKIIERTGNADILNKAIRPHHLRHSIATHLLEQGVSVEQIRRFLGHSLLETTEQYTRVSQKQLKELMQ
jgi:integrase/recombinase XerD